MRPARSATRSHRPVSDSARLARFEARAAAIEYDPLDRISRQSTVRRFAGSHVSGSAAGA